MYRFFLSFSALVCLCLVPALASNVVVLPQENSGATTGYIYSPEPFTQLGTFTVDPLAFQVIWHPNGQKFYVFSKSITKSITVFSGSSPYTETTSRALANISDARISPDGRRLFVLSQSLRIYDTSTDQELTGINTRGTPIDIEFSLDSNYAYVLNSNGTIAMISTANNQIISTLTVSNGPNSLTVAPNGLIYVTGQNKLVEIDGRGVLTQIGADIPLTGSNCLKTQFTPDGSRAVVACNVIGSTQIYVIDVTTRAVANASIPGALAERFKVISNSSVLYYMGISNTVFKGGLATPLSNPTQADLSGSGPVTGGKYLITSDQQPTNRYFFANSTNSVSRINLETNSLNSVLTQPTFVGPMFYTGKAQTGIPFGLTVINPSQSAITGQQGRPLVVRVLDNTSRPLSGVTVNFSTNVSGLQLDSSAAISSKDGYAMVNYTAPATTGTATVTASTSGSQGQAFTINVSAPDNGGGNNGGGTDPNSGIQIVSGNGQILFAQFLAPLPLTVRVRDGAGNPQPNVTVSWTVESGDGNVTLATSTTDAQGLAQTQYGSTLYYNDSFNGPRGTTVRASSPNGHVDFSVTSYPSSGPPPLMLPASPPAITLISPAEGTIINLPAGSTVIGAVKATIFSGTLKNFGSPIPNVAFSGSTGNDSESGVTASCSPRSLSNSSGELSCDLIGGNKLGQANIQVCAGNCQSPGRAFNFVVNVTAGAPGVIVKKQGDNQSGGPGSLTPLALRGAVTDKFGNKLAGVTVRVEVIQGEATIESLFNTTNADGDFSFLVRFGSSPGEVKVRTSAGEATTTWTLTNNVAVGNFVKTSGDNQSVGIGKPFPTPLAVQLFDASGRGISGATVTFAVQNGVATLSASSAVTNSQGIASVTATAGATAGAISVSASAVSRIVTFSLSALPPGPTITRVTNAASFQEGVTPCGLATIFGSNIAPSLNGVILGNSFVGPYALRLSNVSITVGDRTAPIVSLANLNGQEQVTFQTPCDVTGTTSTLKLTVNDGSSTATVKVLPVQPGIFETVDSAGKKIGVMIKTDGTYMSRENPALRGEVMIGFFTGLGQTVIPTTTNTPGAYNNSSQVSAQIIIGVNNEGVPVGPATMAPGLVGLYIVQFQIPEETTTGVDRPYAIGAIGSDNAYAPGNPSLIHVR
ncbi:Ig-like domain-containing protein [Bryobacter aggregatus]|uniref:Ig-like domain-containing protein n=1 Tax=Bryobacter aggregatus TaxID=360054 RepID=UPI0004E25617|nr:Ig-like domain-containing protein [Bryobacter aggregatus]